MRIPIFIILTGLLKLSAASDKKTVSESIPQFSLPRLLNTQLVTNKDIEGKLTVIDFWASWCGPCEDALPFYRKLYDDFHGKGLEILAVSLDSEISEAEGYIKKNKAPFLYTIDKTLDFKRTLEIKAIPTTFLVSKKGEILLRVRGTDDKGLELIRSKIKEELK